MKKIIILIVFINFNFLIFAQNMQKTIYNDGRIIAYIQPDTKLVVGRYRKKCDYLVIENITNQEITVRYAYKSMLYEAENDSFIKEEINHENKLIKPSEKLTEYGYMGHKYPAYYFVDSFVIINISGYNIQNIPQNNNRNQNNLTIPSWAQGTWYRINNQNEAHFINITSTQLITPGGTVNIEEIDNETLYFYNGRILIKRTNTRNEIIFGFYIDNEWEFRIFGK